MIAPDRLEPYTVRVHLQGRFDDPAALVAGLLEDVAGRCDRAGASVIGHVKGHARTTQGSFRCNLVSLRSGPYCAGHLAEHPAGADAVDLDLAVLVYGLPRGVIAATVEEAVERLRERGLTAWTDLAGRMPLPADGHSLGADQGQTIEHAHSCDNRHTHDHGHLHNHEHIPDR